MKQEIDYELWCAMRDLCDNIMYYVDKIHFLDDMDEDGGYCFHIYDAGMVFISAAQMELLRKLKEIF